MVGFIKARDTASRTFALWKRYFRISTDYPSRANIPNMPILEKIPSQLLPQTIFTSILVTTTETELSLLCRSNDLNVRIRFPRETLVAFEWGDDCYAGIKLGEPFKKPWPKIGDGNENTYPYLEVRDSDWLKTQNAVPLSYPGVRHYMFPSALEVVNALSRRPPIIEKAAAG